MAAKSVMVTERGGGGALLPIAVIGIVGYVFYKHVLQPRVVVPLEAQHFVQKLQLTNAAFRLQLDHKRAVISFTINNPNTTAMKVQAIVGRVSVHEQDPKKPGFVIGNIDRFAPIEIRPMSATRVDLTVQIAAINAIAYMTQVLTGKWAGQFINFQGTITANGHEFPVNETIKLSV